MLETNRVKFIKVYCICISCKVGRPLLPHEPVEPVAHLWEPGCFPGRGKRAVCIYRSREGAMLLLWEVGTLSFLRVCSAAEAVRHHPISVSISALGLICWCNLLQFGHDSLGSQPSLQISSFFSGGDGIIQDALKIQIFKQLTTYSLRMKPGGKESIWEQVNLKKIHNIDCDKDDFLLPFINSFKMKTIRIFQYMATSQRRHTPAYLQLGMPLCFSSSQWDICKSTCVTSVVCH